MVFIYYNDFSALNMKTSAFSSSVIWKKEAIHLYYNVLYYIHRNNNVHTKLKLFRLLCMQMFVTPVL